jgi:hypothetical protein
MAVQLVNRPAADAPCRRNPSAPRWHTLRNRWPEFLFAATVLLLVLIRFFEERRAFQLHPGSGWSDSEWMIGYAAGFLRRGLGGSVLAALIHATGLGFFSLRMALTTASYLGLCAWFLLRSWRLGGPPLWRFALLFNPLLLLSFCDYGTVGRKDTLFLWGTLINVLICERALLPRRPAREEGRRIAVVLTAALLSLTLALLHEGLFLFMWLPLNLALTGWTLAQLRLRRRAVALLLLLTFGPALLATLACVRWHGNIAAAQALCRSWQFAIPASCKAGPLFPPALDALSWSLRRGMSLSLASAPWFPVYPVLFAIAGAIGIVTVRALVSTARVEHLLPLVCVPFLLSLPLFVLGIDWGRWMSLLLISSMIVMLSGGLTPALLGSLPAVARSVCGSFAPRLEFWLQRIRLSIEQHPLGFCMACFLLQVPPIPKAALLLLNPPVIVLKFLLH